MNVGAFRTAFPEFSDTVKYPDAMINFWAGLAEKLVLPSVWSTCYTQGVNLYVAHELVLASQNEKAGSTGGAPGSYGGVANNKTVGSVTVGYDSTSTSEKDAGYWNLTNYGRQFIRLARIFGAGAIQL
jgi:hypothetical protein